MVGAAAGGGHGQAGGPGALLPRGAEVALGLLLLTGHSELGTFRTILPRRVLSSAE